MLKHNVGCGLRKMTKSTLTILQRNEIRKNVEGWHRLLKLKKKKHEVLTILTVNQGRIQLRPWERGNG